MCWMCEHPEATFEDYAEQVLEPVIGRFGWAVQAVESRTRPYAYTVGLTARGRPELVVTGRPATWAYDVLDAALAGEPPRPGHRLELLTGPTLQVLRIPEPRDVLQVAVGLYGDKVQALQLVWADAKGRWPWELTGNRQQLLGRPGLPEARAG